MSDLAPLLLGTLLVGVIWRMCSLARRTTLVLVARGCCAGLRLVAIAIGGGRSYVGWFGLDGGVGASCAVLAAIAVGCDAILLLLVHNLCTVRAAHWTPLLSLPFPARLDTAARPPSIRSQRHGQFLLPDPDMHFLVTQCACLPLDLYVTQLASSSWLI